MASFAVLFSMPAAYAEGMITVTDSSPTNVILVGNLSQTYNLTVNVTTNETLRLAHNVTFILPYGLQNSSICNAVVIVPTASQFRCVMVYSPMNSSDTLQANLSFTA